MQFRPVRSALALLFTLLTLAPAASQPTTYPANSGVVDITQPPYNADNTGIQDAAAALNAALLDANDSHALIYLPAGTYRLSAPVEWQNPDGCNLGTTFTCRRYTGLTGAGVDQTFLVLDDNHPDFQDRNNSTSLINTGSSAAMSFENTLRHLTVNTGSGNPGATGVRFMASNVGGIHDVNIVSGDGQGFRGLDLGPNEQQGPAYFNNILVDGFDTGVRTFGNQNGVFMENLVLRNQNITGFFNQQQVVSLRGLDFEGDAQAVFNQGDGGSTFVLYDSQITGTGDATTKIGFQNNNRRTVFLRNVTFSGWRLAYQEFQNGFDLGNLPNGYVEEYTSKQPRNLCDNVRRSLNLPIQPTPDIPYEDVANWINIADYGAVIDNGFNAQGTSKDDSQAFQAALDAAVAGGSETVVIPQPGGPFPARYMIYGTFTIPPTVKRIIGTKAKIDGDYIFETTAGTEPLVFEDFVSLSGINHFSARTLILKHSVIRNYRSIVGGGSGDVYVEDCVGGPWEFNQQDVWARQFNLERDSFNVRINGGSLWAHGIKTERKGTIIEATGGARVEVMGAFHYCTRPDEAIPKPIYVVNESSLSVAGLKTLTYIDALYEIKLRETRNGVTNELVAPDEVLREALLVAYTAPNAPNTAPVVEAGEEQILPLGQLTTTLSATINDDANPTEDCFAASTWALIEGRNGTSIAEPNARRTEVTLPEAGRYVFELSVTDGVLTTKDTVAVFAFDAWSSTEDHDADGTASGNGADARTQGWGSFTFNYGASDAIIARNFGQFPNKSIVRIDLSALPTNTVDNALLEFEIATTNGGLIEDWSYNVFGLNDGDPGEDWVEGDQTGEATTGGVTYETLPANVTDNNFNGGAYDPAVPNSGGVNHERTTFLGTFSTRRGRREKVNLSSLALSDFVSADTDGQVSFILTRIISTSNSIAFATKENTRFDAPRLWVDFDNKALPITLLDFTARSAKQDVHLTWTVADAVDFSHFVVERSRDGRAWQPVKRVGLEEDYVCEDAGAGLLGVPTLFYRLRLVDLDGSESYSPTRTVSFVEPSLRVFPNPFTDELTISSSEVDELEVYDWSGRKVRQVQVQPGRNLLRLGLVPGVYLLRSTGTGETVKLIGR